MREKITRRRLSDVRDDRTQRVRFAAMTDAENEANIASDFDSWPLDDQARGFFFHIFEQDDGRWTWHMIDRDHAVAAKAPTTYENWDSAEAATEALKNSLKEAA